MGCVMLSVSVVDWVMVVVRVMVSVGGAGVSALTGIVKVADAPRTEGEVVN